MPRSKAPAGINEPVEDLWRRSESPQEEWEEDGDWGVSIIGEEVDYWGDVRYEVQWDGWQRKDGTSQTWKPEYVDEGDKSIFKKWDKKQRKYRLKLAEERPGIEVVPGRLDFHNNDTLRRSQALEEQLRYAEKYPCPWPQALKKKSMTSAAPEAGPSSRPLRATPARQKDKMRTLSKQLTPSVSDPLDDTPLSSLRHMSARARGKQRMTDSIASPPSRKRQKTDRRKDLTEIWTSWSGHLITFTNEIDDEDIPNLVPDFEYLEKTYKFDRGVPKPSSDFLPGCECKGGHCRSASWCECQSDSQIISSEGAKRYAYDKRGLFRLGIPRGTEVIECNENCQCDETCPNRVAQQQRTFAIDVFKTAKRGWGVRSPDPLPKGTVLGLYTGLLIPRSSVGEMPYSFDLDGHEDLEGGQDEDEVAYTVNSLKHGNWTRFINHSCNPNLVTYMVSFDTPPSTGMYYIGFVASKAIPPNEELTFDYAPRHAEKAIGSQGRGERCYCKAEGCRGYF
ncbi:SET domain-containing protein [Coprinopsis sp. MPI-PUGE-AT-0042]|nr:SET domain-containing protein [Coprinopsis sp. MPI-PUGE-AT-0042]